MKLQITAKNEKQGNAITEFLQNAFDIPVIELPSDPPVPAKPYEMLGELEKCKSGLDDKICLIKSSTERAVAYSTTENKEDKILLRRLLHEHSCGKEALEILEYIKDHLDQGHDYVIGESSIAYRKLDIALARLNAGPEKGV